jgi:hypothetical protein
MTKPQLKLEIEKLLKVVEGFDDETDFTIEIGNNDLDDSSLIFKDLDIRSIKIIL